MQPLRDLSAVNTHRDSGLARVVRIAAEHADAVDREARFPVEAVTAMREEGLLGGMMPVALGGQGATLSTLASQTQAIARSCASSAMIFAMHQNQAACIVEHGLDQPWHRDFARSLAADQLLIASITSEVGIGGDMRSSSCAVEVSGDRLHVRKAAPTISYGAHADVFLVTARANEAAPPSDQVLVTLLQRDCRLDKTNGWDPLGMRGTCSEGFTFSGEGVADQILPVPFADIAAETMVPVSHLLWSAAWTGIAVDAITRARKMLLMQARRKPGVMQPGAARLMQATGLLQLMQARLIQLLAQYDAAHAHDAAAPAAGGWPGGMVLATAMNSLKHDVSEMCHQVVHQALLICGMAGYKNDTEYSVGRHLRDIYSAQLMISNDRIAMTTGSLLLAQRSDLGML